MSSSFSSERGSWRPKTQSVPNILDESDGEDTDEIVNNSAPKTKQQSQQCLGLKSGLILMVYHYKLGVTRGRALDLDSQNGLSQWG